jgi:hypothetical protein
MVSILTQEAWTWAGSSPVGTIAKACGYRKMVGRAHPTFTMPLKAGGASLSRPTGYRLGGRRLKPAATFFLDYS